MQQQSIRENERHGYDWLSIALHWLAAIVLLALWFVGKGIRSAGTEHHAMLQVHTTIAALAWLPLWWRIVRRFRMGHPAPMQEQRGFAFCIGAYVHHILLLIVGAMLLSGPLMVWARGSEIHVLSLSIAAPIRPSPSLAAVCYQLHAAGGVALASLVGMHILGTLKHVVFNRDGTLDRMLFPRRGNGSSIGRGTVHTRNVSCTSHKTTSSSC